MTFLSSITPACLLGTGFASLSLGVTRRPDTGFKALGGALVALSFCLFASPAHADQFVEAADGARIDCKLSRNELTRISLIGDAFSSVSKIATGYPYNDFGVTHEPLRGDIYISVPPSFAANSLSFFATSKEGFVYKFACQTEPVEAHQLFITNPALGSDTGEITEDGPDRDEVIIGLIKAMASDSALPGYRIRQMMERPAKVGDIEVQLIAEYRGGQFTGQQLTLRNRGKNTLQIDEHDLAPKSARAVAIAADSLEPGAITTAFLVKSNRGAEQ